MKLNTIKNYSCLFAVMFCVCFTVISAEKETADDIGSSYLEFRGELNADEMKNLEKALKGKDKVAAVNAAWRLAAHQRSKGELKKAGELVKEYSSTRDFETLPREFAAERLRCILESAHIKALDKDTNGAMAILNWGEMRKDDFQRALSCLKYAEILLDMAEFERSEGYLKTADGLIGKNIGSNPDGAAIGQGSKVVDKSAAWRELKLDADMLGREIEFEKMKSKYGASYALYVKLRRIQTLLKKSFVPRYEKEAMSLINEIVSTDPQSQFAAAAEYLKGEILASKLKEESPKKEIKDVKEYLEKFVAKQPDGLYRGEALMLLGRISLEVEWDAKESEKYYTSALDYFRKAREKRDALSLYAPMSDDLKKQSEPTQKPTTLNEWKRIVYHDEDPLKLYNTANAPVWYVNDKERSCIYVLGFLAFSEGKYDLAKSYWGKILGLSPEISEIDQRFPNVCKRLAASCDCKHMMFTADEKNFIKDNKLRLKISYAEYIYISERFKQAGEIFSKIFEKATDIRLKALASLGVGCVAELTAFDRKNDIGKKDVLKHFEWVLKEERLKQEIIYGSAMIRCADSLMGIGGGAPKAQELYKNYAKEFTKKGRPDYLRRAEYMYVFCFIILDDVESAKKAYSKFEKKNDEYTEKLEYDFKNINKEKGSL